MRYRFDTNLGWDHIWIIHNQGVSYKPRTSFSYRHLSNSKLIDKGITSIDDIGSSSSYIWLRHFGIIVPLNPFTGKFEDINKAITEKKNIKWDNSFENWVSNLPTKYIDGEE